MKCFIEMIKEICIEIYHILDHEANLNKFERIHNFNHFYNYNVITLEFSKRKIFKVSLGILK